MNGGFPGAFSCPSLTFRAVSPSVHHAGASHGHTSSLQLHALHGALHGKGPNLALSLEDVVWG